MTMAKNKKAVRSEFLRIVGALVVAVGFIIFEKKVASLSYKSTGTEIAACTIGVLIYMYTIMFLIAACAVISEILIPQKKESQARKAGIASIGMLILYAIATQFLFWGIVISYHVLLFVAITLIVIASAVFLLLLLKVYR